MGALPEALDMAGEPICMTPISASVGVVTCVGRNARSVYESGLLAPSPV